MLIAHNPAQVRSIAHWSKALVLAICVEMLALVGLMQWLQPAVATREIGREMELWVEKSEPAPVLPTPPKPQPVSQPKPVVQPPSAHLPPQVVASERTDTPAEPPPVKPVSLPVREAATPVATPPVASAKVADHSEYMAKVRSAVQQAFVYPAAASSLGLHGRVKVKFKLNQKSPANAQVLISSGVSMIDRAALASVMTARYPDPTADINLSQMEFEIWIEYRPS